MNLQASSFPFLAFCILYSFRSIISLHLLQCSVGFRFGDRTCQSLLDVAHLLLQLLQPVAQCFNRRASPIGDAAFCPRLRMFHQALRTWRMRQQPSLNCPCKVAPGVSLLVLHHLWQSHAITGHFTFSSAPKVGPTWPSLVTAFSSCSFYK